MDWNKFISRKLAALICATLLLSFGQIEADMWWKVCGIYVGAQAAEDTAARLRTPKGGGDAS